MSKRKQSQITYKRAGVNVDKGYELVKKIKSSVSKTKRPEILSGLGSFAALSRLPKNIKNPLLVSCTDGVGTKVEIAKQVKNYKTIGIDLVAMCVNDLITCGGEPLLFLDYYVTDKLNVKTASEVIAGIAHGCKIANCSLVGGETAEHPGTFPKNSFDLAGFSVGIVDEKKIIDGSLVKDGDDLIGISSSGIHSNGFSLIRKLISDRKINLNQKIDGKKIGDRLLEPTKIYVKNILNLSKKISLHGISHITGGGLTENIPRMTGNNLSFIIEFDSKDWPNQPLFNTIKEASNLSLGSMFATFNCGIGMVLACDPKDTKSVINNLRKKGEVANKLGYVRKRVKKESQIIFKK